MAKIVKDFLQHLLSTEKYWKVQLVKNWPTIMGNLHEVAQLERIEYDTLVIGVVNSCWLQELYLLSPLLLKTINEKLDRPRIKQLRFKCNYRKPDTKHNSGEDNKPLVSVTLSSSEQQILTTITDPELQTALKQYCLRCHRERL